MKKSIFFGFCVFLTGSYSCENDKLIDTRCVEDNPNWTLFCECLNGAEQNCSPVPDIAGNGECQWGKQTCVEGHWSKDCAGAGIPSIEVCDGFDNDCDALVDDYDSDLVLQMENPCWTYTATAVFGEYSRCKKGHPACVMGVEVCEGQIPPMSFEICNGGIDDDCNGLRDDNAVEEFDQVTHSRITCGPESEAGVCKRGAWLCLGGELICGEDPETHIVPHWPSDERCNGLDDDCNGLIDDNIEPRECGTLHCKGFEFCSGDPKHPWHGCTAQVPLPNEICDNFTDDDCDGEVDEDCHCPEFALQDCFSNVVDARNVFGELVNRDCGRGVQQCINGEWGDCVFFDRIPEQCNYRHDDDCDTGTTDEFAEPRICGFTEGECNTGFQHCLASGEWSKVCDGEVGPAIEICDNLDNDCDGEVDEGIVKRDAAAVLFLIDHSPSMCSYNANVALATSRFAAALASTPHVCAVAAVPGVNNEPYRMLTNGFVPMAECQKVLENIGCNGDFREWNLDALDDATSPAGHIPWPPKFPFIIYVGDEPNQTLDVGGVPYMEQKVAAQTTQCQLAGCQPPACQLPNCEPGPPELCVIEVPAYQGSYAGILNNRVHQRQRFFDITADDPDIYRTYLESCGLGDFCFNQ